MTIRFRIGRYLLSLLAIASLLACAGTQKAVDRQLIKGSVGKKYSEMTGGTGFALRTDYGPQLLADTLADGSVFHVHVFDYESSSSVWFGTFGSVEYSYRISGFKVKNDVIQDWAYALFTPEHKAHTILGIEWGQKKDNVLEGIARDYPALMKTSTDQQVAVLISQRLLGRKVW